MFLPGAKEEVSEVEKACSVLHMENRRLKQIIQLLVEIWVISAKSKRTTL